MKACRSHHLLSHSSNFKRSEDGNIKESFNNHRGKGWSRGSEHLPKLCWWLQAVGASVWQDVVQLCFTMGRFRFQPDAWKANTYLLQRKHILACLSIAILAHSPGLTTEISGPPVQWKTPENESVTGSPLLPPHLLICNQVKVLPSFSHVEECIGQDMHFAPASGMLQSFRLPLHVQEPVTQHLNI